MASSADQIIANGNVEKIEAMQAEIARLQQEATDAKADALRLHREKMEYFEQNIALRAALVELKCHLYAQQAMTDGEIIAACRVIADKALANANARLKAVK